MKIKLALFLALLASLLASPLFADKGGGTHNCMHGLMSDPHDPPFGPDLFGLFTAVPMSSSYSYCLSSAEKGSARAMLVRRKRVIGEFVRAVPEELQEQAAQGGGAHLAELARLMGESEGGWHGNWFCGD